MLTVYEPTVAPGAGPVHTLFWLSKVFATVRKIEYRAWNINAATDSIDIGFRFYPDSSIALPANTFINQRDHVDNRGAPVSASVAVHCGYNMGYGLPIRTRLHTVNPSGRLKVAGGHRDIIGGLAHNITADEYYGFGPFNLAVQDQTPETPLQAGFLIGQTAYDVPWQGYTHKIGFAGVDPAPGWRLLKGLGAATMTAADHWRIRLWVQSSLQVHPQSPAYPTVPTVTRGPTA